MAEILPARTVAPPDRARLVRLVHGYMVSQMIHTAVRLGLPDLVAAGDRSVAQLSEATGTHAPSLRRLLRALASLDVLREVTPGRFAIAPLGVPLTSAADHRLGAVTRLFCSEEFWRSWADLEHSIRTGDAAFDHVFGTPFFPYLESRAELLDTFHAAMAENARFEAPRFVAGYDFGRFETIVDVGGGNGALLHAILRAHPSLRGVIVELPSVAEQAHRVTEQTGLADRCAVVAGDFFRDIPAKGDALLLKSVMHNWDDRRCVRLLRNCRAATPDDGVLLVLEPVLPAQMESETCVETVMSDLNMLALTAGGFERNEAELRAVLEAADYRIASISPTIEATDFRVIEAVPA